ncbi:hypothetical protein BP6252_12147 [Coleophoma cylindrospora]|uniref:Uncharacterized protein n=1 Tax=Coleophoma cylindrospora TaxID=1849047 RepID=A0A3D8QH67_9HELO|nr:hypothetical protein BP6252_12147 [Coleophoma cylindrospora]
MQTTPARVSDAQEPTSPSVGYSTGQSSNSSPRAPAQVLVSATSDDEFDYSNLEVLEGVEPVSGRSMTPDAGEEFRMRRPTSMSSADSLPRRRVRSGERDMSPSARARRERERGSTRGGREGVAPFFTHATSTMDEAGHTATQAMRGTRHPRTGMIRLNRRAHHSEFASHFDEIAWAEELLREAEEDDGDDDSSRISRGSQSVPAAIPLESQPTSSRLPLLMHERRSSAGREPDAPVYRQQSPGGRDRSPTSQHLHEDRHAMSEFLVVQRRQLE